HFRLRGPAGGQGQRRRGHDTVTDKHDAVPFTVRGGCPAWFQYSAFQRGRCELHNLVTNVTTLSYRITIIPLVEARHRLA
ncbi:MAG: hypothetical protein V4578_10700, partial [Pseudomonadota bacterium]